jgi:hypothetical protein
MSAPRIVIRDFEPADAVAFRDINFDWIERFFAVEAKDRETLEQAQARIIDPGGAILMAVEGDAALGCVALIVIDEDTVELAKMGVRPAAQGRRADAGRRRSRQSARNGRAACLSGNQFGAGTGAQALCRCRVCACRRRAAIALCAGGCAAGAEARVDSVFGRIRS